MSPTSTPRIPKTTGLLYWLLVVCGLAGITYVRSDLSRSATLALWSGTVLGVLLGQLLALRRVRAWVPVALGFGAFWLATPMMFAIYSCFGNDADTVGLAFVPAAVAGYLSLSERGGLVAFWYPAVLWMLVILDGSSSSTFGGASLPFSVGLGVFFVAFFRARETRRVAIWQSHATSRLATSQPRQALNVSPLRGAGDVAWTGLVGASSLILAAWMAPHLWQKERTNHVTHVAAERTAEAERRASYAPDPATFDCEAEPVCDTLAPEGRVREYFPLLGEQDDPDVRHLRRLCAACSGRHHPLAVDYPFTPPHTFPSRYEDGTPGSGAGSDDFLSGGTSASGGGYEWNRAPAPVTDILPVPAPEPARPLSVAESPKVKTSKPAGPSVVTPTLSPPPTVAAPATTVPWHPPAAVPVAIAPTRAPITPWRWALVACAVALGMHVLARAGRRALTLAHLTRPFWAESIDQRISNHWQRMLIGLRDAGVRPRRDEQPNAFARRVGIEGMAVCALILERVRHGVRIDEADLAAMQGAATRVFRTARRRAGLGGRVAAWLRWPLT